MGGKRGKNDLRREGKNERKDEGMNEPEERKIYKERQEM